MIQKSKYNLVILLLSIMTTLTVNAQFTVNDLADTNTGAGSSGTLRWCINQVNGTAGTQTITFDPLLSGGTISLTSSLPIISVPNVTIDGDINANGIADDITIDAGINDALIYMFRTDGNGDGATFKGFIMQDTGYEPFSFSGSPTDITIRDMIVRHTNGNIYMDKVMYYVGNALNLSIINVDATNVKNDNAFYITGTATNITYDDVNLSNTGTGGFAKFRFGGIADNITISNSTWDLDDLSTTNDSDTALSFDNNVSNLTITNLNIYNCEINPIYVSGQVNPLGGTDVATITNLVVENRDGSGIAYGMQFIGAVTNLTINTTILDLDQTGSTDDGEHGIYFSSTTTNVNIDGLTVHDVESYGIFFGGVATDISISNSTFDNFDGDIDVISIRFSTTTVSNITMTNVDMDLDLTGNTNDGDWGILFDSTITSNVTLTNVNVNEADADGIRFNDVDNLLVDGGSFNNCDDGIEFLNNYTRSNNEIRNATFNANTRAGLVINVANAVTEFNIHDNIFSNTTGNGYGVWLFSTGGVKNIQIVSNTFFNNTTTGIYNAQADGVLYSQNSFYNNPTGIDNVANNGNDDLEYADGDTPTILSSTNTGVDTYDVTFNVPNDCTNCDVEFFTNLSTDPFFNGRTYVGVATGLSAAGNPHTISVNSGGNNTGYWTTTLKVNTGTGSFGSNGSVSEFSNGYAISPKGPGGVSTGIRTWYQADNGLTTITDGVQWDDISGNLNHVQQTVDSREATYITTPTTNTNFHPYIAFDGGDVFESDNQILQYATSDGSVFFVATYTDFSGWDSPIDFQADDPHIGRYTGSNNPVIYKVGSSPTFVVATSLSLELNKNMASGYMWTGGTDGGIEMTLDGNSFVNTTLDMNNIGYTSNFGVGAYISGVEGINGSMNEVIVYQERLSIADKERVQSYLAIKYGITLTHNYYASDWTGATGTTLWTLGGGYDNDIAGIGRDDNGGLNQKQSKSINTGTIVTMGLGGVAATNTANTNTFTNDKDYLLWGNNGLSTNVANAGIPSIFKEKIVRDWSVNESGTVGDVLVQIPDAIVAGFSTTQDLVLVVADDAGFTTNIKIEPLVQNGTNWEAEYSFDGAKYFTFGVVIIGDFMRHGKFFLGNEERPMKF
ncbi:Right handed beta helix region [Tenacibaculum sediminilitoris]|uniref:beta strand repeat-containing protein n=1 Tax=Tenacibaculum sediminilitoris TaxID=1820334 RepID=UPI0038941BC0